MAVPARDLVAGTSRRIVQPSAARRETGRGLTERIVDTYAEVGNISHLGHCPLPNYETIVAATQDLKEILYPGYRRRDGLHLGNVTYHVGDLIDRLHRQKIARQAAPRSPGFPARPARRRASPPAARP